MMTRWLRWLVRAFDHVLWAVLWFALMGMALGLTWKVAMWVGDAISPCLGVLVTLPVGIVLMGGVVTLFQDAGELKRIRAMAKRE